ncbi:MAG: type II toxin-antitoxin system VapB family antitoxin [Alphaproteobacteria bacterium]|nr:type II toxin-antitoxin system VapB family antitoxin [Alphaproteobacteria bacterium]
MRTTVNLDDRLVERAMEATGERERTKLLHDGLRALIARENARAIIALGGSDPEAWIPERRRPAAR